MKILEHKQLGNCAVCIDLDDAKLSPQAISPTSTIIRIGIDIYQMFIPVTLTKYQSYLIKIPEINPKDLTEV